MRRAAPPHPPPRLLASFEEITWEASPARPPRTGDGPPPRRGPLRITLTSSRPDQSQSPHQLLGAQQFGTPITTPPTAGSGFGSTWAVARHAPTMGVRPSWEFGQPTGERTITPPSSFRCGPRIHDSNPIKDGHRPGSGRARATSIGINPVRSGYNAGRRRLGFRHHARPHDAADPARSVHCLLKAGRIDLPYLAQVHQRPVLCERRQDSPEQRLFPAPRCQGKPFVPRPQDSPARALRTPPASRRTSPIGYRPRGHHPTARLPAPRPSAPCRRLPPPNRSPSAAASPPPDRAGWPAELARSRL